MPFLTVETQIAAGHNNTAGLTLVSSLTASGVPFVEPMTIGRATRGNPRTKANGTVSFDGYRSTSWVSGILWLVQYEYLLTNLEGRVTIRTTNTGVTWANYNAILTLPSLSEVEVVNETQYGHAIKDFVWQFTRLEAL